MAHRSYPCFVEAASDAGFPVIVTRCAGGPCDRSRPRRHEDPRRGRCPRRERRPPARAATPQDSQEHVLAELEAAVAELLDDSVAAVGFGTPSPIDQERGVVVRCVNLPLENAPLRDRMHERFGLPVGLDNDANAAAIGEWRRRRAGRGRSRHAHARDGRRRRRHLRRQALSRPERRGRRARPRRDRPRRPTRARARAPAMAISRRT